MNKFTLIPQHLVQHSDLYMLKHELSKTGNDLDLGVKLGLPFDFSNISDLRKHKQLKNASQISIIIYLPQTSDMLTIEANNLNVVIPMLIKTIQDLDMVGIKYKIWGGHFALPYLTHGKTKNIFEAQLVRELKANIDSLFTNDYIVVREAYVLRTFNRQTFTDYLLTLYMNYGDNLPFPINLSLTVNSSELVEESYEFISIPTTRETLIIFGDVNREERSVSEEVNGMLRQIKYLLKGVKPLSNQELSVITVRTSHIKREIGHLGNTFDADVFELLATLEVQIGEKQLRNLNNSLRILLALVKNLNEVELDTDYVVKVKNIIIPNKFHPFKEEELVHTYCAILSLTASKKPITGLDAPLNYLRSQLSELMNPNDYKYAFMDGIISYLNKKDGTSIPVLRGGWNSSDCFEIPVKFIEDAFSKSSTLRESKENKIYFLFYVLYNII